MTDEKIKEARKIIFNVTHELVMNQLSEFEDDWDFPKNTPEKTKAMILQAIEKHNNYTKARARKLKSALDLLTE